MAITSGQTADTSGSTDGNLGIIVGVLKRADGLPIDLGLSLTCKLVADEVRGLALRENTITFSTATSRELRILALHFDILVKAVDSSQEYLFHRAGYTMPKIARERLKLAYPQLAPLLEDSREEYDLADTLTRRGPFGESPSRYRAFCKEALAASSIPDVADISERHYAWADPTRAGLDSEPHDAPRIAKCSVQHWAIPCE
ncbi:C6 transcription factor [Colletotrichum scovillei]|uniref:C6 transcription factor n=1 Tax=Colletotrichum scovillei TaxID=1209932 RepID=A0A9P7UAR6_9PEZI|nr:C6 transcription factor [Colletotrichum scovillei]KAG7049028.1 C6 transcription factor [Colletotrichum scovillei]KAG7063772.1 C6 transcription factor [Colletotrichum scovillei]